MKELIKITEQNGKQVVSARELYQYLGYDKSQWARWYKKNIQNNEFAFENVDYAGFDIVSNGNQSKDFALTIDFAKKLSMKANTKKGEELRDYFLFCEKKAQQPQILDFSDANAILQLAQSYAHEQAERKRLEQQNAQQTEVIKQQAPKVEYCNEVLQSKDTYNTNQIAKELGTSAITLNKRLHQLGVQYKQNGTWLLYHKYQNKGYTKTTTYTYTNEQGETGTSMHTVWTEKGRLFIHSLLNSKVA